MEKKNKNTDKEHEYGDLLRKHAEQLQEIFKEVKESESSIMFAFYANIIDGKGMETGLVADLDSEEYWTALAHCLALYMTDGNAPGRTEMITSFIQAAAIGLLDNGDLRKSLADILLEPERHLMAARKIKESKRQDIARPGMKKKRIVS